MKKTLILLVLLLSACPVCSQTDDAPVMNDGGMLGRGWRTLSTISKLIWLNGFDEGVQVGAVYASLSVPKARSVREEVLGKLVAPRLEFIEMIDGVFRDAANLNVAVRDVHFYVTLKVNGAPAQILEEWLANARKSAAAGYSLPK